MPLTVFYSWQADTPPSTNRNFIEDALKRALKQINASADVVNAARSSELRLDKDTMGLPGTPPIVEAIFRKIDGCAVFVPDLTFVARTEAGRLLPNANVMIEYGWALKSKSHDRIVAIMNEEFGEASEANLPFNIRHLRWPIRYKLPASADTGSRADARKHLVDELTACIRRVVESVPSVDQNTFVQISSTFDAAAFYEPREKLAIRLGRLSEMDEHCYAPRGPMMFLRVIPTRSERELTPKRAYDKITGGKLEPFALPRIRGGEWYDRNSHGAIVFRTAPNAPVIEEMTQLFKNCELWGISSELEQSKRHVECGVLVSYYEDAFLRALDNYIDFARTQLELTLPLRLIAGITGIAGFKMAAPPGMTFGGLEAWGGRAVESDVIFESSFTDWGAQRMEILMPFFKRVWEAFGLERPDTSRK